MAAVFETIHIEAPPGAIWELASDIAGSHTWIPDLESCTFDGVERRSALTGGGEAVEKFTVIDPEAHSFTYEYVSGDFPLDSYESTFSIAPTEKGSTVSWRAELTARAPLSDAEMAEAVSTSYRASLDSLRRHVLLHRAPSAQ